MAAETVRLLRQRYPAADCTLDFHEPWQLLVAAILAAQCTDERVNKITPPLFAHFPGPAALAAADLSELEQLIRSCGLHHNKARAIQGACRQLVEEHQGSVPGTLAELTALPGVGRKIANLILGDSFHVPAVVVDTHCARIASLIGLTASTNPAVVERDLRACVAEADWIAFGHLMVSHGRAICIARRPDCLACPLNHFCLHAARLATLQPESRL